MQLVERLSPEWTLHRVWHLLYVDMLNYDQLAEMAQIRTLRTAGSVMLSAVSKIARLKTGRPGLQGIKNKVQA